MIDSEILREAKDPHLPIGVDTETTGLKPWAGSLLRGMSLALPDGTAWYLPVSHPRSENLDSTCLRRVLLELAHPDRTWVWFNRKYDCAILSQLGIDALRLPGRHWDSAVGGWLEDENIVQTRLKDRCHLLWPEDDPKAEQRELERLCAGPTLAQLEDEHYYGPEGREAAEGRRAPQGISRKQARELALEDPRYGKRQMWDLTADEIRDYACEDARLHLRLFGYQRSLGSRGREIEAAMPREMRVIDVLYEMERRGIQVDEGAIRSSFAKARARQAEIDAIFEAVGVNPSAPHQLASWIYEDGPVVKRTPKGAPSVDKEALALLGDDPKAQLVIEWRRLERMAGFYFAPLIEGVDGQGRIHPSFKSAGSGRGEGGRSPRTGRLSCEAPNLQQIPRENTMAEVRRVFIASRGMELWDFDLSQAELRVAASISNEEWLIEAFAEGRDVYLELAGNLASTRDTAKVVALGYQYGAGEKQVASILTRGTGQRVTPQMVRRAALLVWQYERQVPRLARTRRWAEEIAREEGRIPLHPPGRFRHFRGAYHAPEPYKDAFNSWCQGGVAEVVKDVMVEAQPGLNDLGSHLLIQLHDALVIETPPGLAPKVRDHLQQVVDGVSPFSVRQRFELKPWSSLAS